MALKPGDTLLNGQYHILRQLGRGGFGFVYQAQDTLLHEEVAIKELIPTLVGDDAMLKRFLAEARATMRLTSVHIVRTHNVFQEGGTYYIVMECMAGGSLEQRLREHGPLPVEEAVQVAAEVCEGLHVAHQAGVIHCDLKPANILFGASGSVKVGDFGIAHISKEMLTRTWQTRSGFAAGTLPYMSPEQADGVRDDPRVDIYALGAVLYRVLTGRTYLDFDQRETPGAQADNVLRIRKERPKPPSAHNSRVPAWLDRVVLKALAKRPEERYANTRELKATLVQEKPAEAQDLRHPQPQAVPGPAPVTPEPPSAGLTSQLRNYWPLVGGALALLVVIVIVAVALNGGERETATPVATETAQPWVTATALAESATSEARKTLVAGVHSTSTAQARETDVAEAQSTSAARARSTATARSESTATAQAGATSTAHARSTATARIESTARARAGATATAQSIAAAAPTATRERGPTATPVPRRTPVGWFWRGQGPFSPENGVIGFVNDGGRRMPVRIDGVRGGRLYYVDPRAVRAFEVPPGQYNARVWGEWAKYIGCSRTNGLEVQARRVLAISRGAYYHIGNPDECPWYEEPDPD